MTERSAMNKKTVIRLIIAFLLIAVGSYFYAFVKKDAALYDTAYTRSRMVASIRIDSENDFVYEFDCDQNRLTGIRLLLSAAGRETGSVRYALIECGSDREVSSGDVKLSRFKNGKFTFLDTDTIKDSAGRRYRLVISCANPQEDAALASVLPDGTDTPAVCFTYIVWDMQTMIVSAFMAVYLVAFVMVLVRIFRR